MKKFIALSIAIVSIIACSANRTTAQEEDDIYRHFKGTIGKDTVWVDLLFGFNGGSNYGGSSYYRKNSDAITRFHIGEPPSRDQHQTLYCVEVVPGSEFERNKSPKWEIKMTDNKLQGKWYSIGKTTEADIDLTEDYSRSYPMEIYVKRTKAIDDTVKIVVADNFFLCAKPSAAVKPGDAAFINSKINKIPVKYLMSFLKDKPATNQMTLMYLMPAYNDNGFLTLKMQYGYESYPKNEAYLCLDVEQKRMLVYDDIMENDPELLSAILGKAYSKLKGMNAADATTGISPTKNVMLTYNGIIFHYNNNQIAGEEYVSIYVPYSELSSLLKKDFKKRMGL